MSQTEPKWDRRLWGVVATYLITDILKRLNFIVMSGWFLLALAIAQYQRIIKLLKKTTWDIEKEYHIVRERNCLNLGTNLNVPHHTYTSSWRHNWYVNSADLFRTSSWRLTGTYVKATNLRRCSDVTTGT